MIYFTQGFDDSPLRQVPEHVTKLYGLVLNPMRGRAEEQRFLAASESREELAAFLNGERIESYSDQSEGRTWRRSFRAGGPLEWFNPPWSDGNLDSDGNGIIELMRDGWRRSA